MISTFKQWLTEELSPRGGVIPGQGGQSGATGVGYNNPSNPPGGFAQYEDPLSWHQDQKKKKKKSNSSKLTILIPNKN